MSRSRRSGRSYLRSGSLLRRGGRAEGASGLASRAGQASRPTLETLEERKLLFSLSIDPDIFLAQQLGIGSSLIQASGFQDDFTVGTDPVTGLPILVATGTGDGIATVSGAFGYLLPSLANPAADVMVSDPEEITETFDSLLPMRDAMGNLMPPSPFPTLTGDPLTSIFSTDSNLLVTAGGGAAVSGGIVDFVMPPDPMDPMATPEPTGDADLLVIFDGAQVTNGVNPFVSFRVSPDMTRTPDAFQPLFQAMFNATDVDMADPEIMSNVTLPAALQPFQDVIEVELYRDGVRLDLFDFDNDGQPGYDADNDGTSDTFGRFALNDPTGGMGGFDAMDADTTMAMNPREDLRNANDDPLFSVPYRDEIPAATMMTPVGDGESEPAVFNSLTINDVFDEFRLVFTGTLGAGGQATAFHIDDLELMTPAGDFVEEIGGRARAAIVTITGPIGATATFFDLYDRPHLSNQVAVDFDFDGFTDATFEEGTIAPFAANDSVNFLDIDPNDNGVPDGRVQVFETPRDLNGDGDFADIVGGVAEQTADFDNDGTITQAETGDRRVFEAGAIGIGRINLTGFNAIDPLTGNELDTSRFSFSLGGGDIEFVNVMTPADVPENGLRAFNTSLVSSVTSDGGVPIVVDNNRFVILPTDFLFGEILEDEGGFGFAINGNGDAIGLPSLTGNAVIGSPFVRSLVNPADRTMPLVGPSYFNTIFQVNGFGIGGTPVDGILPTQGVRQDIFEGFDFELLSAQGSGGVGTGGLFGFGQNGPFQFAGSGIELTDGLTAASSFVAGGDSTVVLGNDGLLGRAQVLQTQFNAANDFIELRRPIDTNAGLRGGLTAPSDGTPGSYDGPSLLRFDAITLDLASVTGSLRIELYEDTDLDGVVNPATDRLIRSFANVTAAAAPQTFTSDEAFSLVRIVSETGAQIAQIDSIALREAPLSIGDVFLDATVFGSSLFTGALGQWSSVYQLGSVSVAGDLGRFTVAGDAGVFELEEDEVTFEPGTVDVGVELNVGRTLLSFSVGGRNAIDVTVEGNLTDPDGAPAFTGLIYQEMEQVLSTQVPLGFGGPILSNYETLLIGSELPTGGGATLSAASAELRPAIFADGLIRNGTIGSAEFINTTSSSVIIQGTVDFNDPFGRAAADGQDVFAFATDGSSPVIIEDLAAANGTTVIRVVDQNGLTLAAEQLNPLGTRVGNRIEFNPPEPGVFYLVVAGADDGTAYQIAVSGIAPVTFGSYREGVGSGTRINAVTPRIEVGGGSLGLFRSGTQYSDSTNEDATTDLVAAGLINVSVAGASDVLARRTSSLEVDIADNLYQFVAGSDVFGSTVEEGAFDTARGAVSISVGGDLGRFYTGRADGVGLGADGDINDTTLSVGGRIARIDLGGGVGLDTGGATFLGGVFSVRTGLSDAATSGDVGVFRTQSLIVFETLDLDTSATAGSVLGLASINETNFVLNANGGLAGDDAFTLGVDSDLRFIDVPQINLNTVNSSIDLPTGTAVQLVDDAGGSVTITFTSGEDENGVPVVLQGRAIVVPVEDSAGVAIARIEVDLSMGGSLNITSSAVAGTTSTVSIGRIFVTGASDGSSIVIGGDVEIDVWRIDQIDPTDGSTDGDGLALIQNTTPGGDIVAIDVANVDDIFIQDGHLGLTQTPEFGPRLIGPFLGLATGSQGTVGNALGFDLGTLQNNAPAGIFRPITNNVYDNVNNDFLEDTGVPIDGFLNGVVVRSGEVNTIRAGRSIGDVITQSTDIAGGVSVNQIIANNLANLDPDREFSGLVGSIYSFTALNEIRVGDGQVGRSDSPFLDSGIYAIGFFDVINGIPVGVQLLRAGGGGAGLINGASINGVVGSFAAVNDVTIAGGGGTFGAYFHGSNADSFWTSPAIGFGRATPGDLLNFNVTDANGVVFGTEFAFSDVNVINIQGAFDASSINAQEAFGGTSNNGIAQATGFLRFGEIRNSTLEGETVEIIPTAFQVGGDAFGLQLVPVANTPGVDGNISDLFYEVDGSILGTISATNIARTAFSVDNVISSITTTEGFLASQVVAGQLSRLSAGTSIRSSSFEISGPLVLLDAVDDIVATNINVTGPNGRIDEIRAGGSIVAIDLLSAGPIGSITTQTGDLGGVIRTTDPLDRVNLIRAARDILLSTDFAGDVGTIVAGRNVGKAGVEDTILVAGNLESIRAGGDALGAADGLGQIYSDVRVDQSITGTVQIDGLAPAGAPQTQSLGTPEIIALGSIQLVRVDGDFRGTVQSASNGIRDIQISGSLLESGRIIANDGSLGFNTTTGLTIGGDLLGSVIIEESVFLVSVGGDLGRREGTARIDGATVFAGDNFQSLVVGGNVYESFIYAGKTLINVSIAGSVGLSQNDGADTGAAAGLSALLARIAGADGIYVDDASTSVDESADNINTFTDGDFTVVAQAGVDGTFFTADDTLQVTIAAQVSGGGAANLVLELSAGADGRLFTRDDVLSSDWSDADDAIAAGVTSFDGGAVTAGSGTNGDYTFFRLRDADGVGDNDVVIVQVRAATASGDIAVFTGEITDNGNGGLFNAGNTDLLVGVLNMGAANTIAAGDQVSEVTIGGNAEDLLVLAGLDELGSTPIADAISQGFRPGGVSFGSFMTSGGQTISAAFDAEQDTVTGGVVSSLTVTGNAEDVRVSAGVAAGFDGRYNTADDQVVAGFGRVESVSFGSVTGDTSVYADRRRVETTVGGASGNTFFTGASAAFTNASIGQVDRLDSAVASGVVRFGGDLFNVNSLAGRPEQFVGDTLANPIPGTAVNVPVNGTTFALPGTNLSVTLTGAGAGTQVFFDLNGGGNPTLYLINTQENQILTIAGPGTSAGFVELDIISNDDASLDSLITQGFTLAGDSKILVDLLVKNVNLAGFESSESVVVGEDIQSLIIGDFGAQDSTQISTGVTTGDVVARFVRLTTINSDLGNLSQNLLTTDVRFVFRSAQEIVINGDFRGEINVRRSISNLGSAPGASGLLEVNGQVRRAIVRVGDSLGRFVVDAPVGVDDALSETRFSVGDNVGSITVDGNVFDTALQVGGDLGLDGRPDAISGGNDDRATTGFIGSVTIDGTFVESDIVAGILRGSDGFFGTNDDSFSGGLSTIGSVSIRNLAGEVLSDVLGSDNDSESYAIIASGVNPFNPAAITVGGIRAESINNFQIQPFGVTAEALAVEDVQVIREGGDTYVALLKFNQSVNFDTIASGLEITEVRANGIEIPLTLTTPLTAGQYRLEADENDSSTVRVVFSRSVTQRDLESTSAELGNQRLSELAGPGLFRFDFADETAESPVRGLVATGTIDSDTARPFYAVVGDAGDVADVTPTDPNDTSLTNTILATDPIDFYEAVNLDPALAQLGSGESYRIRGIAGDHPDEQAGFGNAADVDSYYISLEAGQILLIDLDVLGAAGDVTRTFAATTNGAFQFIDSSSQLGAGGFAGLPGGVAGDVFTIPESRFAQIQILESDTFVLNVGGVVPVIPTPSNVAGSGNVTGGTLQIPLPLDVDVATSSTIGSYDFAIQIFDDGDSGFSAGSIYADSLGTAAPDASAAGDGTRLVTPQSFLFDAVSGLGGLSQIYTSGQSAASVFSSNDNVLPTFVDGDFTFIAMPGADGALFSADDVIRVEIAAEATGFDVPLMLEIRDGGDGILLDSTDDIVSFDPANTLGNAALLDTLRALITDPIDSMTPSLAGADRIFANNINTVADETADNVVNTPVTIGDLTLTLQEDALAISNAGDAIFVEVDAVSREFANLLPDLDLFAEPSDPMNLTDDFGRGLVLLAGDDFLFGTADDQLVLPSGAGLNDLLARARSVISGGTSYLDDAATMGVDERADNLTPSFINGSFMATPTAGADGLLFTSDDVISVALQTIDPVTAERSALLDTSNAAVTYEFTFGLDGTPFTADDRIVDVAAFNALRLAPGTELTANIDGFDYTLSIDSADNPDGILGARTSGGGNVDEALDNVVRQILTGDLDGVIQTGDGVAFNNDDLVVLELTANDGVSQVSFGIAGFGAGQDGIIGTADDARESVFVVDPFLLGAGADNELGFGFRTVLNQSVVNPAVLQDDPNPNDVVVGDFDNDGVQDIVVTNLSNGTISLLRGTGGRAFTAPTIFDLTVMGQSVPLQIVAGDVNGDGADDLVINDGGTQLTVLTADGIGGFNLPVAFGLPGMMPPAITDVTLGDFTGDGNLDAVVTDDANGVTIFTGDGAGNLAAGATTTVGLFPAAPIAIDLDLDGNLDLVYTDAAGVSVMLGDGAGNLAAPLSFAAGIAPRAVAANDLNSDGLIDLVVTNTATSDSAALGGSVAVLLGSGGVGAPAFSAPVFYGVGNGPTDVAITNVDLVPSRGVATSPLDIVVANASGSISTLIGNGDGTFQIERRDPAAIGSRSIAVLDSIAAPAPGVSDADANAAIVTVSDFEDSVLVMTQSAGDDDGILSRLAGPDGRYADDPNTTRDESADNRVSLAGMPEVGARGDLSITAIRPGADLTVGTNDDQIVLSVANVVDTNGVSRTLNLVVTAGADGVLLTGDDVIAPDTLDGTSETVLIDAFAALPAAGFEAFAGADGIYSDVFTTTTDDVLVGIDGDNAQITSTVDASSGKFTTVIDAAIGDVNRSDSTGLLFTDVDIFHIGSREAIAPGSTIRVTIGLDEIGSDIGAAVAQASAGFIRPAQFAIFDTTNSTSIDDAELLLAPTDFSGRAFSQIGQFDSEFSSNSFGIDPATGDFFVEFQALDALSPETETGRAPTYAIYLQGQIAADYRITVEVTPALTPIIPAENPASLQTQNVFLEFNGGRVDWLLSGGQVLDLQAFDSAALGFNGRNADDVDLQQFIIDSVVSDVNDFFSMLSNFSSITGLPEGFNINVSNDPSQFFGQGGFEFEDFSTIRISSTPSPFGYQQSTDENGIPLFGITERSDVLNTDRNDEGVIFVGDYAGFVDVASEDALDDFINSLGVTIVRQVGELLGLRPTVAETNAITGFATESNPIFGNSALGLNRLPAGNGVLDVNGDGFTDDIDGDGVAGFPTGLPGFPAVNPAFTPTARDVLAVDAPIFAFDLTDLPNAGLFEANEIGDRVLADPSLREYFFPRESAALSEFVLGRQNAEFLLDRIISSS